MALRFVDSFDHYATANISQKWTSVNALTVVVGRHGNGLSGNGNVTKTLDPQSTWTVGFAMKNPGQSGGASPMYQLYSLTAGGAISLLVQVQINLDESVSVITPSGVIGVSPAYDWSGFHYIELQTTLTGTATITASCNLRINTETVVTGALGVGFGASSLAWNAAKANVHFFSPAHDGIMDDLYITDGNGGTNTGFVGDVTIGVVYPNGDVTVNWTGTGSSTATHYLNINGTNPDDDTSYEYSTNTGSMDLFDWQDIAAFSGTVKGVQYSLYARKDDEGARVINMVEGTTGTHTLTNAITSRTDIYLNDNYDYHHLCLDTSPTTGTGWTVADFNAARFGFVVGTNT